ncbi:MAG: hypothetical protein ACHP78_09395 [Terriglobales bacterium]
MHQDIFLRAHTVAPRKPWQEPEKVPTWPDRVLVFDTETTIDTRQELTFGAYRVCQLVDGNYLCSEEGLFHADDLDAGQRRILKTYVGSELASIGVKSFPPKLDLKLYRRSKFVEKVFWKAVRDGGMVLGLNLPFDLSRLAVGWARARRGGWSLIFSERRSRKTGKMEPNRNKPRVRVNAAFISLIRPEHPEEWPDGRFLDLHTLLPLTFNRTLGELFLLYSGLRSQVTAKPVR